MIIIIRNTTNEVQPVDGLSLNVPPLSSIDLIQSGNNLNDIAECDSLVEKIAKGIFIVSDGTQDLSSADAIKYVTIHNVLNEQRDRSGKLRVHQTSRKVGLTTHWTGAGDDPDIPKDVGNGQRLFIDHKEGQPLTGSYYIDFNCVENETWIHEVILNWKNCNLDYVSAYMVSRATGIAFGSGTNYTLHSSGLIVPTMPGTGDINITTDITTANGGLVYLPEYSDARIMTGATKPPGFWNAEWDSTTERYINISAAPDGSGWYNMFPAEVVLKKLVNKLSFLDNGFNVLNSSDTDQIGQGMRLKLTYQTHGADHDWQFNGCMVVHRKNTGQ